MSTKRSATVFYSRKTLFFWIFVVTVLLSAVFGYFLKTERNTREKETARLQKKVRNLSEEGVKLRVANQILQIEASKLKRQIQELGGKISRKPQPPSLDVSEKFFPVGKAVAVIPGRLFVTLSRLDGERARIRIAAIEQGEQSNRQRTLAPGQTWKISVGKNSYALLLHSLKNHPLGALLSIRKFTPSRRPHHSPLSSRTS
jgi:hypothetical protein